MPIFFFFSFNIVQAWDTDSPKGDLEGVKLHRTR